MSDLRQAAQQALEAPGCERLREWASIGPVQRAAVESFLHAALGQPEQAEPVAWLYRHKTQPWKQATVVQRMDHLRGSDEWHEVPLYTHPPRRDPLTVTELQQALVDVELVDPDAIDDPEGFDNGFTLQQIDALHRRLMEPTPPTIPNPQPAPQP